MGDTLRPQRSIEQADLGLREVGSVEWLVERLVDDLVEDRRALFELVWTLNTFVPSLSDEEKLERSRAALQILLARPEYELRWFYWGKDGVPPLPVPVSPPPECWAGPHPGDPVLTIVTRDDS